MTFITKAPPRNTFGLYDPTTGQRYPDIISSHLQLIPIFIEEYMEHKVIAESRDRNKEYTLLLDHATLKDLLRKNPLDCLVSFQRRTDGNYAVARTFNKEAANIRQMKKSYL